MLMLFDHDMFLYLEIYVVSAATVEILYMPVC
jgi:hypothetical protein